MGETKVPLVPKRIASLCIAATDSLVALAFGRFWCKVEAASMGRNVIWLIDWKASPPCREVAQLVLKLSWLPSPT